MTQFSNYVTCIQFARTISSIAIATLALSVASVPVSRADESHAKDILKAMSDYLAAQQAIAFGFDSTFEVVTKEDQKLALASSGTAVLERPDKLRATRSGGFVDVEFIFDGKTLTLHGKSANVYTQAEIEGSIDDLIDELRYEYGRPLPAADLLLSQPYGELMKDVIDIKDLGSGIIGGVECDFLAFRTEEVDWQIWVAQGDEPRPCRYVITTKDVKGSPQYSIQITSWATGDDAKGDFRFVNDANAKKVELEDLHFAASELPQHFKTGDD